MKFRILIISNLILTLVFASNIHWVQANAWYLQSQPDRLSGASLKAADAEIDGNQSLLMFQQWLDDGENYEELDQLADDPDGSTPVLLEGCMEIPLPGSIASCAMNPIQVPEVVKKEFEVYLPLVVKFVPVQGEIVEQTKSSVNLTTYADQKFGDIPAYSIYLVDDFMIFSPGFNLQEIYIPGNLYNGGTTLANASQLVFQIYADNGGNPAGDPVNGGAFWSLSVAPSDARITLTQSAPLIYGNVKLTLSSPLNLLAGRYWLVFYPEMNVSQGQYGRYVSDSTNGYDALVMNPGGGFLPLAPTWTSIQDPAAWSVVQQDLAFRLKGQVP